MNTAGYPFIIFAYLNGTEGNQEN